MKKFTLILFMMLAALSFQTAAQNLGLDNGFNGGVTDSSTSNYVSTVQPDGKVLVGGGFRFVNGVSRSFLARFNTDGTPDTTFNVGGTGLDGDVLEILVLSGGKILIGGSFANYNGTPAVRLARLNADGTLDTTFNVGGSGVSGSGRVVSIAPQTDGRFIVAGQTITGYNGNTSNGIFRINADGSFDSSFVSGFATVPGLEQVVVQADGKILIGGGNLSTYGGIAVTPLIRVNSNGTLDFSFPVGGDGGNTGIAALAIQTDGKILIGGVFGAYNAVARNAIARINPNGTLDTSFVPPTSAVQNYVEYFAVQTDGKVLAAGSLNLSNGTNLPVMRLNTNGTQDTSLNSIADGLGYHVTLQPDGKILTTGFFNRFTTGETHDGIARYNANGTLDNTFNPSLTGIGVINAMARQTDGKTVVVGRFRKANGIFNNSIARFNTDGTFDNTFATGTGAAAQNFFASVNALAIQPDGKILVGGRFGTFNGSTQKVLIRLNSNGSVDTSFNLSGDVNFDFVPNVEDILVLPDGKIMVGGALRNTTFQVRGFLRLNSNGSVDETFNSGGIGANSTVWRILRQTDGKYIIAGQFVSYNGTSRPRIARINTDGTLDTTFTVGTGANSTINDAVLQTDGKIIIGGAFTTYNGTARNRIARINGDGTLDTSFNVGTGANSTVNSVAIQPDGKVLIGGLFTDVGGTVRNRLARLNSNGSLDNSLFSGFDNVLGFVNAMLLQPDGKLLLGGTFTNYNGTARNNLVRLTTPRTPFDFDGDGKTDLGIFRPAPGEWWINRSSNGQTFATQFGNGSDKIVPVDFTGDGKADVATWRPSTGEWYVLRSEDLSFFAFPFGANGDVPVPADYDGDGKADAAVFRPSILTWFIQKSSGGTDIIGFGAAGDKPVVADYDGDGKADIAIYRANGGVSEWWIRRSSNGSVVAFQFGAATDKPVQGDYTGDGKVDIAIWRPSTGEWFILRSEDFSFFAFPFGTTGDVPVPGDYDGDGKFDAGVFRPSSSTWFIQRSTAGTLIQAFGIAGDLPLPSAFLP